MRTVLAVSALLTVLVGCDRSPPSHQPGFATVSERVVGPCGLEISKLKYNQRGVDDGSLEVMELHAGSAEIGATLGSCGVTSVATWHASADGTCAPADASHSIDLTDVVVPPDGYVVLGRVGSSIEPPPDAVAATTGSWLPNGPDLVTLSHDGVVVLALAIGKSGKYPSCALPVLPSPALELPDDPETTTDEGVEILCDGAYRLTTLSASPLRAPNVCPVVDAGLDADAPDAAPPSDAGVDAAIDAGNPRACAVHLSKLDVTMPRGADEPSDAHEAVELRITGSVPAGAVLGDCGVATLSPFDADTDDGSCGPEAGFYDELSIADLAVPPEGRVVIGNLPGSARAWPSGAGQTFEVIQNGPDILALRSSSGAIVDAVSYASQSSPDVHATCGGDLAAAHPIPADVDTVEETPRDQVLVRCDDGSWAYALDGDEIWGHAAACGPAIVSASSTPDDDGGASSSLISGVIPPANGAAGHAGAIGDVPPDDIGAPGCSTSAEPGNAIAALLVGVVGALVSWLAQRRVRRPRPCRRDRHPR